MIRLSRRTRRLASAAAGGLILYGCAGQPVAVAPPGRRDVARPGRPGFVVAAPRGDRETDDMAAEIARRTGFGLVVAEGGARDANAAYEQRVREAAGGPLRFYAAIHDGDRAACTGSMEITTVGIDRELALRLRALAELIRDAHLRTTREVPRLDVLIQPADAVTAAAAGAPRDPILRLPPRALQIELPRCPRRDWRDTYAAILSDFLVEAVALPVGR